MAKLPIHHLMVSLIRKHNQLIDALDQVRSLQGQVMALETRVIGGVISASEALRLWELRQMARRGGDFAAADEIKAQLLAAGVHLPPDRSVKS